MTVLPRPVGETSPAPVDVRTLTVPGASGELAARLYRGARSGPVAARTLLVFFHGGGFVDGDLDGLDASLRDCARGFDGAILAATYAMATNRPFPAAAEDAYAVLADCAKQPKRYGWNGRSLVVGGVEAGGNLAAVAALMARDRGGPALAAQLLVTPMLDPGLSSGSMRGVCPTAPDGSVASRCVDGYRCYLPRTADRVHPYASPLLSSRMKGLPRTLLVSVAGDPLAGEADAYADRLRGAAVAVESVCLDAPADRRFLADASTRGGAIADPRVQKALALSLAAREASVAG